MYLDSDGVKITWNGRFFAALLKRNRDYVILCRWEDYFHDNFGNMIDYDFILFERRK
jgi:hypothetical protein